MTSNLISLHEDLHPLIFEFLVGAKKRNNWAKFRRGLQGLPEVCRAFGLVWTLAPIECRLSAHAVNCDAAARAIGKMGGSLEGLSVTVRYIYAKEDLAMFTQSLLYTNGHSLSDVLPNLRRLTISPTFEQIGLSGEQLNYAIMAHNPEATGVRWMILMQGGRISDCHMWEVPAPSALCDFARLGALPPKLVLHLDCIRPGANLDSIETLDLDQVYEDRDIHPLKTSNLLELKLRPVYLEGCVIGNRFTNAILNHLPSTLKRLRLDSSPLFKIPCQFPATLALEKLVIKSVNFNQSSLMGLPVGLLELTLDLGNGYLEDGEAYSFPTLDVTDLPPALTVLKVSGPNKWGNEKCV
jgi:hypothetical protein